MKVIALLISSMVLVGCGGGGGGGGGSDTIDMIGEVSVPQGQQPSLAGKAFANTALDGAHVNVCTIQGGTLEPLSAHPTVLADSSGSFVISIDKNDVPADRQLWVCAGPPGSSSYVVLAPVPQDLLPADLTEVSTVSVNPNTNRTIITRYACGQNIMLFNANKCLPMDQDQLQVLDDALNGYFNRNPGVVPDLRNLAALLQNIADDAEVGTIFESWLSEVPDVSYDDFITDAQNFDNPTIPPPEGSGSVSIGGFACDLSAVETGIVELTIAASGTAGGGDIDVFTVFLTFDGETLLSPDSLSCGTWQQSGGLGTCTKLSVSNDMTDWLGTYSSQFSATSVPDSVTVQVRGFKSGSPTVLAYAEETVSCQ